MMTFIPSNYIDAAHPAAVCRGPGDGAANHELIGAGDNRSFGFNHTAVTLDRYRTLQRALVLETESPDGAHSFDVVPGSSEVAVGASESYLARAYNRPGSGALDHGVLNRIDPSDYDETLEDCHLRHGYAIGTGEGVSPPTSHTVADHLGSVHFDGVVSNKLISPSPTIDWKLRVAIDTQNEDVPRVRVIGSRDQFPAYEIYVDGHAVYTWAPGNRKASELPVVSFGASDIVGLVINRFTSSDWCELRDGGAFCQ